jgi:hypothetical protein
VKGQVFVWVREVISSIPFIKLIGWEIEWRNYAEGGGDQTFTVVVLGKSL